MTSIPRGRRWSSRAAAAAAVAALLLAGAAWAVVSDPAAVPTFDRVDTIEARVQGCVTCHGQQGQGTANGYFPRIAGKPPGYLFNQLRAFRDGSRRYVPMNYLVAFMPDAYLQEIADHFAKLRPAFAAFDVPPVAPEVREHGHALVTRGDPRRQIPACVACHGQRLTGMEPGIPALVGLRPAYITAQLTRWRTGERHALEPDCMRRIASRLDDPDLVAIAAWLGSLPAPADLAPDVRENRRMPLACGSQP
jgi:cytochrome c553